MSNKANNGNRGKRPQQKRPHRPLTVSVKEAMREAVARDDARQAAARKRRDAQRVDAATAIARMVGKGEN
jgi:hypothetical protein